MKWYSQQNPYVNITLFLLVFQILISEQYYEHLPNLVPVIAHVEYQQNDKEEDLIDK